MNPPLTKRDVVGPGVLLGREGEVIGILRDALKAIAAVEPSQLNTLAWGLVLEAREALTKAGWKQP